ncbi:MAG: hypothetical protein ABI700_08880, partial [Chloroflexota bacterium]
MKQKYEPSARSQKILLAIHLILYEIFFIYAFFRVNLPDYAANFFILLFWTPFLLLHVAAHYHAVGRGS